MVKYSILLSLIFSLNLLFSIFISQKNVQACTPEPYDFQVFTPYETSQSSEEISFIPKNPIWVLNLSRTNDFSITISVNGEAKTYETIGEISHSQNSLYPVSVVQRIIKLTEQLQTGDMILISYQSTLNEYSKSFTYQVNDQVATDHSLMSVDGLIELKVSDGDSAAGGAVCDYAGGHYRTFNLVYTFPIDIYQQIAFIDYGYILYAKNTLNTQREIYGLKYLDENQMEVMDEAQAKTVTFSLIEIINLGPDSTRLIKDYEQSENDRYRCTSTNLILNDGDLITHEICLSIEEISAMEQMLYGSNDPSSTETEQTNSCQSIEQSQSLSFLLISALILIFRRKAIKKHTLKFN